MAWCLDFHAGYRCRHAGACCRAGWTIPFEDGTVAARDTHDACVFLDGPTGLCSIHRRHGIHALPLTCRMFPRVVLHDARGTFISLSHFCPTAVGLLFDAPGDGVMVDAPGALADIGELDGLDARREWPPLLRPGVLMDAESYGLWERHAISLLARHDAAPEEALRALDAVTSAVTAWTPGEGALIDHVRATVEPRSRSDNRSPNLDDRAVKRWLAARLFGAWTAYQGDGLHATLRYLHRCLDTLRAAQQDGADTREAIRQSDLRILHYPDHA